MTKNELKDYIENNMSDSDAATNSYDSIADIIDSSKDFDEAIANPSVQTYIKRYVQDGRDFIKQHTETSMQKLDKYLDGDYDVSDEEYEQLAKKDNTDVATVKAMVNELKKNAEDKATQTNVDEQYDNAKTAMEQRKQDVEDYSSWSKAWNGEAWKDHSLPVRLALATAMKLTPQISNDQYIAGEKIDPVDAGIATGLNALALAPGAGTYVKAAQAATKAGKALQAARTVAGMQVPRYVTRALQYAGDPIYDYVTARGDGNFEDMLLSIGTNAALDNVPYKEISNMLKGTLGEAGKVVGPTMDKFADAADLPKKRQRMKDIDEGLMKDLGIDYNAVEKQIKDKNGKYYDEYKNFIEGLDGEKDELKAAKEYLINGKLPDDIENSELTKAYIEDLHDLAMFRADKIHSYDQLEQFSKNKYDYWPNNLEKKYMTSDDPLARKVAEKRFRKAGYVDEATNVKKLQKRLDVEKRLRDAGYVDEADFLRKADLVDNNVKNEATLDAIDDAFIIGKTRDPADKKNFVRAENTDLLKNNKTTLNDIKSNTSTDRVNKALISHYKKPSKVAAALGEGVRVAAKRRAATEQESKPSTAETYLNTVLNDPVMLRQWKAGFKPKNMSKNDIATIDRMIKEKGL